MPPVVVSGARSGSGELAVSRPANALLPDGLARVRRQLQSWAVLSVLGEKAILADYLCRRPEGSDLPDLFAIAAAEAIKMGAKKLVFWDTRGGPGSTVVAGLPGERRDAGFPLITVPDNCRDGDLCARFVEQVALTPAMYDVV